ncbi:hypothetical protein PVAP13_3KG543398 [Panicum virgatum]|uniref:F-box domain-containing protein n=1 Tax=Panicum virgatum TaxID=38727 RepID=A0A8T0V628_PANVG|nr:hypothetical protein PVAP13_3KG543398 [Panicum virgatum]
MMFSSAAPPDAAVPDEILGEIFLRLGSAADLARASAACTAFLRVARLLRRNRLLYRSPVVGFLPSEGPLSLHPRSLHHAEPPHRSASAAVSLAQLVDLTFSFLPDPNSWHIRDASGGRLLLAPRPTDTTAGFVDLVVCDPLHRRYVRIPPIPDDLTTGTSRCGRFAFLAPAGEEESSFRVAWLVKLEAKAAAFVFSSATGKWCRVTFDGWRGSGAVMLTSCRYYTHRSLYQTSGLFRDVLMLDTRRMEFSVVRIPSVQVGRQHAIVEAGEGTLRFLTLGDGVLDLYCKAWQDADAGAEEWRHEKRIPLPDGDDLSQLFAGGAKSTIFHTGGQDIADGEVVSVK